MSAKYHSQVKLSLLMRRGGVWARSNNLLESNSREQFIHSGFQDNFSFLFFLVEFVYKLQDRW